MAKVHHGNRWRKMSLKYRRQHFFCEVWLSLGKSVKADHVDHIIRIEDGGAIWSSENWMAMSEFWHNRKSGAEQLQGSINIPYFETEEGKIPKDREAIIKIMVDRHKRDIQDIVDGYRTIH